jgi:hypothetical protein
MVGSIRGFASFVKKENTDVATTHCVIHTEVLVSEVLEKEMKKVRMMLYKWLTLGNKDQFTPE